MLNLGGLPKFKTDAGLVSTERHKILVQVVIFVATGGARQTVGGECFFQSGFEFFRFWRSADRNCVTAFRPITEIDEFASLGTKGTKCIGRRVLGGRSTTRAFHCFH